LIDEGPSSAFERALPAAEIVNSQPFRPACLTAERIARAARLQPAITAGIGSDHVDLQPAIDRGITVAERRKPSPYLRRRLHPLPALSRTEHLVLV
jgi:lactate dehydrogenase-like 2-hydroxyacid dehydrogenase